MTIRRVQRSSWLDIFSSYNYIRRDEASSFEAAKREYPHMPEAHVATDLDYDNVVMA